MMRAIAIASLVVSGVCSIIVVFDLLRHPQRMKIMNVVWPITPLYCGPLGLLMYFTIGRHGRRDQPKEEKPPLARSGLVGGTHCGAGCTIGDVVGEFGVFYLGIQIAGQILWAYLVFDFIFAWLFGIVFQYFSIVPMRNLSFGKGVIAAIKADTLSIAAFQLGMYAWMILARFVIVGADIPPTHPTHWLSMQVAMIIGLATTYPMNMWLIRKGLKERM